MLSIIINYIQFLFFLASSAFCYHMVLDITSQCLYGMFGLLGVLTSIPQLDDSFSICDFACMSRRDFLLYDNSVSFKNLVSEAHKVVYTHLNSRTYILLFIFVALYNQCISENQYSYNNELTVSFSLSFYILSQ